MARKKNQPHGGTLSSLCTFYHNTRVQLSF